MIDEKAVQKIAGEATIRLQAGETAQAIECLMRHRHTTRKHPFLCYLAGLAHASLGANEKALAFYDRAIALQKNYVKALSGRALTLQELGRADEACLAYERCVRLDPQDAAVWRNYAVLLAGHGELAAAFNAYGRALDLQPDYGAARYGAAVTAHALGRDDEALELCARHLADAPNHLDALLLHATLLHKRGQEPEALSSLDAALALSPSDPRVLCNKGVMLHELGQWTAAAACFDAALAEKPDFAEAWLGRGNSALKSFCLEKALDCFSRAMELDDGGVASSARCGRALALVELGRFDEAMADFDRVLSVDPHYAEAQANRATLRLLLGDFERGLEGYEYRWVVGETPKTAVRLPWPEWTGGPLAGKTILVMDEAGLGDLFMLVRYLPMLVERGARVVMQCREHMHAVLRSAEVSARFIVKLQEAGDVDCCAAIFSLPRAFGTRPGSIPARVPYLRPDPALAAAWARRIGGHGFKIGLVWQGNIDPKVDRGRSAALADFAPLAGLDGVRLISLQRHGGVEQLGGAGFPIETLGDDFDAGPHAFVDAAAAMAHLDLVVTVDTSIGHLAGALGRPVWVALKQVPEWRWLLERNDSPWYPTMRLFRQEKRGEWRPVFERIARELGSCGRL
jgi:tetratricopeptide (TPR) repeat protein